MRTRRTLGAVLTLLALTLSLAETVWASTCAPMGMDPVTAAVEHGTQPDSDCHGQSHGEQDGADPESQCPFSPAVTQGCAAAASLPTHPPLAQVPSLETAVLEPTPAHATETLIGATHFRPPRA